MKHPPQSAVLYHARVPGSVGSRGAIHEGQTRQLSWCWRWGCRKWMSGKVRECGEKDQDYMFVFYHPIAAFTFEFLFGSVADQH